jgi:hypothetical protein
MTFYNNGYYQEIINCAGSNAWAYDFDEDDGYNVDGLFEGQVLNTFFILNALSDFRIQGMGLDQFSFRKFPVFHLLIKQARECEINFHIDYLLKILQERFYTYSNSIDEYCNDDYSAKYIKAVIWSSQLSLNPKLNNIITKGNYSGHDDFADIIKEVALRCFKYAETIRQ